MTDINYLLLAGKAYVKLTEDSSYVTGDSMGLKVIRKYILYHQVI